MSENVPELRFPEFKGEWEEKSLFDISHFSKGKGISKNDISEEGLECIRYGELYTTYNEKISKIVSKTNLNPDNLVLSDQNDIIIPTSGETAIDLATASCVMKSEVAIGGDTTIIKTDQNGLFLTYCLNNKRNNISQLAQGVSVVHLYATHLKILKIYIPSLSEQNKIVSFLSKVDEKIGKLEEKQQQWETYKKGIMQQIFNQKLRFKDENGEDYPDWEEKKLADIFKERKEKGFEDLELLSVTLEKGVIKREEIEAKDNSNGDKSNYKRVLPNDIPYNSMRMWQGASGVSSYEGIVSPAYTILIPTKEVYPLCIAYYFKTSKMIFQFRKYSQGLTSDTWNLKYPLLSQIKIKIPSLPEQTKIANFLSTIDDKIEEVNKELELNNEFKKGLLQKMFC